MAFRKDIDLTQWLWSWYSPSRDSCKEEQQLNVIAATTLILKVAKVGQGGDPRGKLATFGVAVGWEGERLARTLL